MCEPHRPVIVGYPPDSRVTVGDQAHAKIGGAWRPVTVAWLGDHVAYVHDRDGERHRVSRFSSELSKEKPK